MLIDDVFNKLFLVRVPIIATYSPAEINEFGYRLDGQFGDDDYVKYADSKDGYLTDMTTVMLSVDKMIDIYSSGYKLAIVNSSDIIKLTEMLDNYLNQNYEFTSIHLVNENTDDRKSLIKNFINEILSGHKYKFEKHEQEKTAVFDLPGVDLMSFDGGTQSQHRPEIKIDVDDGDYRETYTI